MIPKLSPDGHYYKFDMDEPEGHRLFQKSRLEAPWGQGQPVFSIQRMSAAELRFVAGVIDEARAAT